MPIRGPAWYIFYCFWLLKWSNILDQTRKKVVTIVLTLCGSSPFVSHVVKAMTIRPTFDWITAVLRSLAKERECEWRISTEIIVMAVTKITSPVTDSLLPLQTLTCSHHIQHLLYSIEWMFEMHTKMHKLVHKFHAQNLDLKKRMAHSLYNAPHRQWMNSDTYAPVSSVVCKHFRIHGVIVSNEKK